MTTYVISLGYMANEPHFPCPDHSKIEEVGWEKLKRCFQETCADTRELTQELATRKRILRWTQPVRQSTRFTEP